MLIYLDGLLIDDPNHLTPYWEKFKNPPKDGKFILTFSQNYPKDLHQTSNIFFTVPVADSDYLMEHEIIEKKDKNPVIHFKNICLFQLLTVEQFKWILGFCLNKNASQLELFIYQNNRWRAISEMLEDLTFAQSEFFNQYISIGYHNYMIKISRSS